MIQSWITITSQAQYEIPCVETAIDLRVRSQHGSRLYRKIVYTFYKDFSDIGDVTKIMYMGYCIPIKLNGERKMDVQELEQTQEVIEKLIGEVGLDNIPPDLDAELDEVLTALNEELVGAQDGSEEEGSDTAVACEVAPMDSVPADSEAGSVERDAE